MQYPNILSCALLLCLCTGCLYAPPQDYVTRPVVTERQQKTLEEIMHLLPADARNPESAAEARWLTETAYRAAAAIARYNDPRLKGWFNNMMVNSSRHWQERGLCWHYQHDLYRELRRRPLKYFALGCCVMDRSKGAEHHCIYVAAQGGGWPNIVILDAWLNNGRLKIVDIETAQKRHWEDEPKTTAMLNRYYPEGHNRPFEHWVMIRGGEGMRDYIPSDSPGAAATYQGQYMQRRIQEGQQRRGGRPYSY